MAKIIMFFVSLFASGQAVQIDRVTVDPPGGVCNARANLRWNQTNDYYWGCDGTSWKIIGVGSLTPATGTVTSVGFSTNLGTVTGSPVTTSGTLTNTVSATQVVGLFSACSGVQYLGADGACHNYSPGTGTVTSIATTSPITGGTITTTGTIACATCVTAASALTSNLPVFGAGSQAAVVGTRSGNTTEVATVTGSTTSGNCAKWDANGNAVDAGVTCGGGGSGACYFTEQVLSGTAETITFSSIPQTCKNLRLVITARCDASATFGDVYLQFNSDTAANYSRIVASFLSTGTTVAQTLSTAKTAATTITCATSLANVPGVSVINIPAYTGTTFYKFANSATGLVNGTVLSAKINTLVSSFLWANTSAITDIVIGLTAAGNFIAGSVFDLYGD